MAIVVARGPELLNLFLLGDDGIYETFWALGVNNDQWSPLFRISSFVGPSTGELPTANMATVIARTPGNMDVFAVGKDGGIYSTKWSDDSGGGWSPVFRIGSDFSVLTGTPGVPVTAVARTPDNMDLFTVGTDGGIYSTTWNIVDSWSGWYRIGSDFRADDVAGRVVTAVSRTPQNLDLFVAGKDKHVYSTTWNIVDSWSGWYRIDGFKVSSELDFPPAVVTPVARTPDNLDLFTIGEDGGVFSTTWNIVDSWSGWYRIGGGDVRLPGMPVNVVARKPDHLDLFTSDFGGNLYSTWWDISSGWANWFRLVSFL